MVTPAVVYMVFAMTGGMNIGVRHILPVYVFLTVPIAGAAWALAERNRRWLYAVVLLLVFQAVSVLHAFPDYIAYTNEAFGGPANAYKYVSDSSADWGQQLKSVKRYLDARGVKNCWFAYFSQVRGGPRLLRHSLHAAVHGRGSLPRTRRLPLMDPCSSAPPFFPALKPAWAASTRTESFRI